MNEILPREIVNHILSFLGADISALADIVRCRAVCRLWKSFCDKQLLFHFWEVKYPQKNAPSARLCHIAGVTDHYMMVHGGDLPSASPSPIGSLLSDISVFDFKTRKWTTVRTLKPNHYSKIINCLAKKM